MRKLIVFDLDDTLAGIKKLQEILHISLKDMIYIGDALFAGRE